MKQEKKMEWQPIETAPLGTAVLLTDGSEVVAGEIKKYSNGKMYIRAAWSSGADCDWDSVEYKYLTHWMPLPSPPQK